MLSTAEIRIGYFENLKTKDSIRWEVMQLAIYEHKSILRYPGRGIWTGESSALITQLIMLRVYDIFSSTLYSNQAIIIYVILLTVPSSLGELTQAMFVTLESCELLQVTANLKWHIRKKMNLRKRGNLSLSVVTHTSFYAWNLQSSIVAPKGNFWLNLLF